MNSITVLFFALCMNIAAHFKILQHQIRQIKFCEDGQFSKGSIREIVIDRMEILHHCEKINEIYKHIFLVQILHFAGLLTSQGFVVAVANENSSKTVGFGYFISYMFALFLIYYAAEQIKFEVFRNRVCTY
jgi:hypothetical protein